MQLRQEVKPGICPSPNLAYTVLTYGGRDFAFRCVRVQFEFVDQATVIVCFSSQRAFSALAFSLVSKKISENKNFIVH